MPNAPRNGNRARVDALTKQGLSASQIGRVLTISPGTVYSHRNAIRRVKANGSNNAGLGNVLRQAVQPVEADD